MSRHTRYVCVRTDHDGFNHLFDSDETQIPYCGRLREFFKSFKVWAVKESDAGKPGYCDACLGVVCDALADQRAQEESERHRANSD